VRAVILALLPLLVAATLGTAPAAVKEDKSPKMFLQVQRNIDDENAEAAEMARLEAQSDKDMGEDDDESSSDDTTGEESFVQVRKNIDDDNAEAAEMARLEAQSDKDMGEDDDESSTGDDDTTGEESFVQVKRNIDATSKRIMKGLGNNDLDSDLMDSADEDLADLQNMKEADEAKSTHRTALTSHTVQVQETTAQRAARYFALHGMSKVGLMLGDELSTAQKDKIQKEAKAAKDELASEEENDSGKTNQWKAVDALRRRSLSSA